MQSYLPELSMQPYRNHGRYPRNLTSQNTEAYPWELEHHEKELKRLRSRLCIEDESGVDLPIRDLRAGLGCGNGMSKQSRRI
jgi:hypothetical protein